MKFALTEVFVKYCLVPSVCISDLKFSIKPEKLDAAVLLFVRRQLQALSEKFFVQKVLVGVNVIRHLGETNISGVVDVTEKSTWVKEGLIATGLGMEFYCDAPLNISTSIGPNQLIFCLEDLDSGNVVATSVLTLETNPATSLAGMGLVANNGT